MILENPKMKYRFIKNILKKRKISEEEIESFEKRFKDIESKYFSDLYKSAIIGMVMFPFFGFSLSFVTFFCLERYFNGKAKKESQKLFEEIEKKYDLLPI